MRSEFRALMLVGLLLPAVILSGCASKGDEEVLAEEVYYQQARSAMEAGRFNEAEENLEFLETYYPFGRYAEQAQLDLIYSRYQNLDLEGARSAADSFLRLNPQSEHADYALYLRGLASYNLDLGLAARYFPVDVSKRAPGEQRQAFDDFSRLVNFYPNSIYAPDARQRMIAIRNRMAELELHAARYYIKREAYMAANNRARYIVEHLNGTLATEEALIIMAETYRFLDLKRAAEDSIKLLSANFPDSDAFAEDGSFQSNTIRPQDRSLTNVVTFGLIGDE